MDPDMVRQQEEAEREALVYAEGKPAARAAAKLTKPVTAASSSQGAALSETPAGSQTAMSEGADPADQTQFQPTDSEKRSLPAGIMRFFTYGLTGAFLGGGLGIVAAVYFQVPAGEEELAIFGSAGVLAMLSGVAYFFSARRRP